MKNKKNRVFHDTCFACGTNNKDGLKLEFRTSPEGCSCQVAIPSRFQSYDGIVHGGIIATLLDAVMVHCLREEYGNAPITCRLEVRYLQAIPLDKTVTVTARSKGNRGKIFLSDSEIRDSQNIYARARGAFIISKQ